jgi:DNA invertase Pin-like site-specific DNA recombinase
MHRRCHAVVTAETLLTAGGSTRRDGFRENAPCAPEKAERQSAPHEGDTLIVTKLDRLARSTQHLLDIADQVKRKGAHLQILAAGVDTGTATGKLMFTMIGAIGEFERSMMLERQREGIAKAKTEGKYKGRAPTARAKAEEVRALHGQRIGATEIAKRVEIASVYRILDVTSTSSQ